MVSAWAYAAPGWYFSFCLKMRKGVDIRDGKGFQQPSRGLVRCPGFSGGLLRASL